MPNQGCETNFRRIFEYLSQPSASVDLSELVDPNWVNHDPTLPPFRGIDGVRQLHAFFWQPFSELKMNIEKLVLEGDYAMAHFTMSGKHTGDFMGTPPTNKSFRVTATGLFRFQDCRMAENWVNFDSLGMLQQLGIVPMPGQADQKAA